MDTTTLRRTGALLGSAALLASLTVATVAAPASAGKCEPLDPAAPDYSSGADCYYLTDPIFNSSFTWPDGVTLNGTDERDMVGTVPPGGTFNGGGGLDSVGYNYGTFNGGPDGDFVGSDNYGTFNGGPDGDYVTRNYGTFNGGGGEDGATWNYGTFAGGGGSDCYEVNSVTGTVWSAAEGWWNGGVCTFD